MKGKKIIGGVALGLLGLLAGTSIGVDVSAKEITPNSINALESRAVSSVSVNKIAVGSYQPFVAAGINEGYLNGSDYYSEKVGNYDIYEIDIPAGMYSLYDTIGYSIGVVESESSLSTCGFDIAIVGAKSITASSVVGDSNNGTHIYHQGGTLYLATTTSSDDFAIDLAYIASASNTSIEVSKVEVGSYSPFINVSDGNEWDNDGDSMTWEMRLNPGLYSYVDVTGYSCGFVSKTNEYDGSDYGIYGEHVYSVNSSQVSNDEYDSVLFYVAERSEVYFVYNTSCDDFNSELATCDFIYNPDYQEPTITGTNNFIVNINNPLSKEEILSHVSAYDETDGEVSVYFESCDYDPSSLELGEFDAVVAAKDNSGNVARYDIVIHVVDIDKPTYTSGQTSYTTNYKTRLSIENIKNALVFSDNYDEDLTLNVVSDNYSESYNTVGTYYVKVTATDSSNNVSDEVTVTINVIDDVNPIINGDDIIQANSDDLLTEEEILAYFTATDEYCTDATLSIENYSSYSENYNVVSDYSLTIKAVDDYGNSITKNITIHVNDKNKPTFADGTLSYDVSYDETLSLDTIKSNLQFNDDVDDSLVLNITSDTYTENKGKVGTYYIKVTATDLSNNVSDEVTVTINVYDHKAPVISSPGTIETGNNLKITIEEIKAKISVNDALDGPITNFTIEGYENYSNNYNVVGQYQLTIKANDINGNNASATITINVNDKIAPEITFDDYFIVLQEGEQLTEEMIKNMASKVLGIDVNDIVEVLGEYNTSEVGEYSIELRTINNETYTFKLSVNEAPEIVEYRALEWHEWLWKWFSILFNYEVGYTTESFWDFGTRCGYIAEVYSTGQIKVVGDSDTTEDGGSTNEDAENKVIIEALSYHLCSIEQSDLQSIYYEKGHIYLIPKGTYEDDDGDQAILITDKVSFSDNYLNELVANEFDVVLVLENSAPSDMMFTKYGVSFVVIETDNTYTEDDFKMEVNNESI